ncbi:T9SS type A sorting domain-containing protein, partial [candidate division KSB1 bacterium]|nr:T9SS type A sorting domain-containing protein [candidate division KSB1 bacterium]
DAASVHEPDDVVADAVNLPAIPTDGTKIRGYLYKDYTEGDSIHTNWNDFDLYKFEVPEAGMIITAETFTSATLYDHPEWCRDLDTEIYLVGADGTVYTDMKNDDKKRWGGDPWDNDFELSPGVSNTYSRLITPPVPSAGIYYLQVNSYYNSIIRTKSPARTDIDPGGGEYLVSVTLTNSAEQEPNNEMANANLIMLETITDAALSSTDSVDYFKFWADSTRMYTLNTIVPRGVNARNVIVFDLFDENGDSVLMAKSSGEYHRWGGRLSGWVPLSTGFYYCKISADVSAFTEDYPYQLRLWYGTPVSIAATVHEPDDSAAVAQSQEAIQLVPGEPYEIHSYLYADYIDTLGNWHNWNDFDLYKIEVNAGDTLVAETFTAGPDSCIRDTDTEIYLLDAEGNPVPDMKNDDKVAWAGDPWATVLEGINNTFSRLETPAIPEGMGGIYYIQVNSYFNSRNRTQNYANEHKSPGGGEYILKIGTPEHVSNVASAGANLPTKFDLSQNYPNPFNPTTNINYSLPKEEIVKLTVYNMLGQRVVELVNKKQPAGFYSLIWDAKNTNGVLMSSGIYFYRIEAGSFVKTNKMLLLK